MGGERVPHVTSIHASYLWRSRSELVEPHVLENSDAHRTPLHTSFRRTVLHLPWNVLLRYVDRHNMLMHDYEQVR